MPLITIRNEVSGATHAPERLAQHDLARWQVRDPADVVGGDAAVSEEAALHDQGLVRAARR